MLDCSTNHELVNKELPGHLSVFHTVRKPCGSKSYDPLCEVLDRRDPARGVKDWEACVPPSASRDSAEREVCCSSRHIDNDNANANDTLREVRPTNVSGLALQA